LDEVVIVRCKERGHYTLPDGVVVEAFPGDIVHVTAEDAARLEAEGKVERYA
jgi:hypothetical protein